jgi:hypothetical protein
MGGVTTAGIAAGATVETGAGTIGAVGTVGAVGATGGVLGATSAATCSVGFSELAASVAAGRRGNAAAATISTKAAITMPARRGVARFEGGRLTVGGFSALTVEGFSGLTVGGFSTAGTGLAEEARGTLAFFASGRGRWGFLAAFAGFAGFLAFAPLFASTSAETSNVQRTGRPGRIATIRFATPTARRNARAGRRFFKVPAMAALPITKRVVHLQLCNTDQLLGPRIQRHDRRESEAAIE